MTEAIAGRHGSRGQILVEAAIALPIAIFVVLGALQIMLVQHGRAIAEYAAYCAARAGIVHDADHAVMRNAALVAALPLYGRTDTLATFRDTWALARTNALLGSSLSGVPLVDVEVTSPDANAFAAAQAWQYQHELDALSADPQGPLAYQRLEIDFDDGALMAAHPEAGRLALTVRVLYPLRIPVIGRLIFEVWLLGAYLGGTPWAAELPALHAIADASGVYLVPLRASYAMQMQSNPFAANVASATWFGP
ncbi:MAG: TadE/TadG family type IV pilus assembly protein [Myxococcota bacterium]|nr:TadE family protein [Myxococcota bacterium]